MNSLNRNYVKCSTHRSDVAGTTGLLLWDPTGKGVQVSVLAIFKNIRYLRTLHIMNFTSLNLSIITDRTDGVFKCCRIAQHLAPFSTLVEFKIFSGRLQRLKRERSVFFLKKANS